MTLTPEQEDVLTRADWIVLNSSAGKDSQAMMDYVNELRTFRLVPRSRVVVAHADLGRMEWPGTKDLAKLQASHYGFRFEVVECRDGAGQVKDLLRHVRLRGRWPSPMARYCTSDHKRTPVMKLWTRLVAETFAARGRTDAKGRPRQVLIVNAMGMRGDESPARAKRRPWFLDGPPRSNGKRQVYQWLPIHDRDAAWVWHRVKTSGVPHHPAYDLGMPRLSCCFCIYAPRDALLLAGKHNPGLLAEYVQVEKDIGHKFRKELPIAEIKEALDAGAQPGKVVDWTM